jgi:hypothetical protein
MRVDTVADLMRSPAVSANRLDDALRAAAPRAMRACETSAVRLLPRQLRDAVIASLPAALHVGIPECIVGRWWPAHRANRVVPGDIAWVLQPRLEWLHEGAAVLGLTVVVRVRLVQPGAVMRYSAATGQLATGEDRAWSSWLALAVADEGNGANTATFYENRAEVHLPQGHWKV